MNIKDVQDEEIYCNVVDAVELSLGLEKGKSLETCQNTLKGEMNLGGINVDFFDSYKVLTVKNDLLSTIYNVNNTHNENDPIFVDEINYNIKIEDYLRNHKELLYSSSLSKKEIEFIMQK